MYKTVEFKTSEDGTIGQIILNRPKKLNAVSFEMLREMDDIITKHVNKHGSLIRVLVLSGNGKHFSAGIDLSSAAEITTAGVAEDEETFDVARRSV